MKKRKSKMFHDDCFHIIPSVRSVRYLSDALKTKEEWILLSNIHIGNLKEACRRCHAADKKVIVNHEIVGGLGSDKAAFHFLKSMFAVDCVMGSSQAKLGMAKKEGLQTIRRIALADSLGVEQMKSSLPESKNEIIELRPSYYAIRFLKEFQQFQNKTYIAGGFVETREMIEELKAAGFQGVTTSCIDLWE